MCSQGVSLCCAAVHVERRPLNDSQLVEGHSGWQGTTPRRRDDREWDGGRGRVH